MIVYEYDTEAAGSAGDNRTCVKFCALMKYATVVALTKVLSLLAKRMFDMRFARAGAFAKTPACPLMPPMAYALASDTCPHICWCR